MIFLLYSKAWTISQLHDTSRVHPKVTLDLQQSSHQQCNKDHFHGEQRSSNGTAEPTGTMCDAACMLQLIVKTDCRWCLKHLKYEQQLFYMIEYSSTIDSNPSTK